MADNTTKSRYYQFYDENGKKFDVDANAFDSDMKGFSEAYPDVSMRMVDKNGEQWDIPVANVEKAMKEGGYRLWQWEQTHVTVPKKAQKQVSSQPAQVQQPADGGYKPTWQEQMTFGRTINSAKNTVEGAKAGLDNTIQNLENYQKQQAVTGGVAKSAPKWNPETGEMEQSYITSAGTEHHNQYEAEDIQRRMNEAYWREAHPLEAAEREIGQDLRDIRTEEERLTEQRKAAESNKRPEDKTWWDYFKEGFGASAVSSMAPMGSNVDRDMVEAEMTRKGAYGAERQAIMKGQDVLMARRRLAEDAQQLLSDVRKDKKDYGILGGLGRAGEKVLETALNPHTWDFGEADVNSQLAVADAVIKADSGLGITSNEQKLLDTWAKNAAINSKFGDQLSGWTKAGMVTGESLPFMLEMAMNPASGLGQAATTQLLKYSLKKYGTKWVKDHAKSMLAKKIATRLIGDMVGAGIMASTTGAARVAADYEKRMTGQVDIGMDANGDIIYNGIKQETKENPGAALFKALSSTSIENWSEMAGNYLGFINNFFGKALGKTVIGKAGRKALEATGSIEGVSLNKAQKFIYELAAGKGLGAFSEGLKQFADRTQWHGVIGEYLEEEIGNIANAAVVGDMTFDTAKDTGVFNLEQNIDTFCGVALMGGFMSAMNTAGFAAHKWNYDVDRVSKANAQIFGDDLWRRIKTTIDSSIGDPRGLNDTLTDLIGGDDTVFDKDGKKAILKYTQAALEKQGAEMATYQPRMASSTREEATIDGQKKYVVTSLDNNGNTISQQAFDTDDEAQAYQGELKMNQQQRDYKDYLSMTNKLSYPEAAQAADEFLAENGYAYLNDDDAAAMIASMNDPKSALGKQFMQFKTAKILEKADANRVAIETFEEENGWTPGTVAWLAEQDPMQLDDEGLQMQDEARSFLEGLAYPAGEVHVEHEQQVGTEAAQAVVENVISEEEPIDPNNNVGKDLFDGFMVSDKALKELFERNEELKEEYERLVGMGLSEQEVISSLDSFRPEEVQTVIDYFNAEARYQSFMNEAAREIDNVANRSRQRHTFKGTIDGVADLNNVRTITDGTNRYYLVSGDVTTDPATGRITGSTSGLIIGMDLDGSFVNLNESDGYSLDPVVQTLDQFEEEERIRLQEQMTQVIDPNQTMNQQLNQPQPTGEQAGAQAGASTGTGANEAPAAPLSSEPQQPQVTIESVTDKDGIKRYEQGIPVDDAIADIQNDGFDVNEVADASIAEAQQAIDKINKKPTKTRKDLMDQKSQQSVIDYYNNVKARWAEMNQPAEPQPTEQPAESEEIVSIQPEQPNAPEYRYDTPEAARKRGFKVVEGQRINRQEEKPMPHGMEVEVQYSTKDKVKGRLTVSELGEVQGSHLVNGQRNEKNFIPEAQPKAEFGADRQAAAQSNASETNFRPELMLTFNGTQSAYSGSTTQTNRRGEVIQGNGRRNLAEYIYAPGNEAVAQKYKEFLMAHADELGTTAEAIAQMEKPFAHIVLDVTDEEAIRLGQFTAADLETGGKKIPEVASTTTKLGNKFSNLANIVLSHEDPDASLAERIEANADEAVRWLNQGGYINNTEAKTLLEDKAAARQFIKDLLTDTLFSGASPDLRTMFYELPKNIQSAIVSVIGREVAANPNTTILKDIQESIVAYHELVVSSPQFAGVKGKNTEERYKAANVAVLDWLRQINLDGSLNKDKFSNFALELAKLYRSLTDQKTLAGRLRDYYDLVSGSTRQIGMFDEPGTTGAKTREEAIKQIFEVDYGRQRTVPLAGNNQSSEERGEDSQVGNSDGERDKNEGGSSDTGGRDTGNAPEGEVGSKPQSREDYLASHPLTEEQIMADTEANEDEKLNAIDFLNGEDSVISRFYYDQIYERSQKKADTIAKRKARFQGKKEKPQEQKVTSPQWQYQFHYDKETGRALITRDDVSGPVPIQDGTFYIEGKNLAELRGILENPANNLGEILKAVDAPLHNAEVGEQIRNSETPTEAIETAAQAFRKEQQDTINKRKERWQGKKEPAYGADNKLVTTERYEELKKRMKEKMRGQLNSGIDPELISIGAEMAMYHIEAGAKKFADYATRMIADIGDVIRPYLQGFYEAARRMPGMEELRKEMDPTEYVDNFDVLNYDKQSDNTVNEHKEENNETEKVVSLQQEASEEVGRKPEDADKYRAFSQAVAEDMLKAMETGEQPYKNIKSIRAKAKSVGLDVDDEGHTDILLQELVEDGLVSAARQYVNTYMVQQMLAGKKAEDARTSRDLFNDIVKLYYLQPTISLRSSNRIKMQQYSTPLPMSFVADVFATPNKNDGTVLEPTAGNGMMVFAVPEYMVHANELDQTRLDNLRAQKFQKVTDQDATLPFEGDELYDAIIANPPFGAAPAKDYDGKEIRGLAEQIALNALSKMKDDGKAAIIIGGNMEYDKNGAIKSDKAFFTYLYDHYNVKGVIDMDGKLYSRQGTTYPTRLILIDGRRSEEERAQSKVYPPTLEKSAGNKVNSFEELYDLAEEIRNNNNKTDGTEILRTPTGIALPVNNDASGNTNGSERGRQPRQNDTDGGRNERGGSNKGNQKSTEKGTQKRGGSRTVGVQQPRTPGLFDTEENPSQPQPQTGGNRQGGSTVNNGESRPADVQGERTVDNGVGLTQPKETPTSAVIQQAPQQTKPKVEEKRELDTDKLSYRPHNTAFSLESVAPAAMVEAMDNMLSKIEKEHGNIDEWVTKELGYDSVEDMHNALAAEQVDSVAMAIYQMKHGQGMIIGDQTGVGKGRQMAALIRWACRQGKKPVFITQKDDLFTDLYRDLVDIGSGELRPFIFNASTVSTDKDTGEKKYLGGFMLDANGKPIYRSLGAAEQTKIFNTGKLPDDYDFAVLTYSQVNTGDQISQDEAKQAAKDKGERYQKKKSKDGKPKATPKATFLRALAKDNYMFLDESHTAAGKSNTGYYFQSILKTAKAVTFASATFAKRPDTMPMYALRTAMSKAKVKAEKLIEIIENGGVALQEIMSRALTQAGQMVRRERDMSDVVTDWKTVDDPATVKKARENYDRTIEAFNAIIDFQKNWVSGYLDNLSKDLAEVAASAGMRQGTEDLGIKNVPFASKTYNYTKQLMLALKVDAIVDEVVKEIEAGRHPVIALENTMGSMLDDYAPGDTLEETTFAASLLKGLKGVLRYTITDEDGKQQQLELKPEQLGTEGAAAYHEVEELIRKSTSGIFISPLDAITEKLKQKGYKVGELTGRQQYVELDENTGEYTVRRRTDRDKKKMQREFNNGSLDVLILNKSASTGISLHASEKFSDKRQRTMIIAQPLADINDYMQMIGRIDRTGQVHRGYYINLGLPVPAEGRFLMMLSTKLKSLNANTTTSQENESNDVEAPDLLNKYGSKVVVEYLRDNPDVYVKMGEPLKKDKSKLSVSELDTYDAQEDDARKITGYVALLPTDEQDAFYNDVVRRYNELIKYLNDTGSNDLKISVLPLRARTIDKQVSSEGADPNGSNPFAGNAYVEWVEMDVLKKPMKASEIEKTIEQLNPEVENAPSAQAKTAAQEKMLNGKLTPRVRQILDTVERETQAKLDKENERYEAAKKRAEEDIDAKAETINKQQKRTEEQKKEAIDKYASDRRQSVEESHNNMVNKIDASHDRMVKYLEMFRVGDSVLVPDDLTTDAFMGSSPAIFCGFKAKDEGVTPSTTLAVFATLDGRRKIEIKLSDWGALVRIDNMTQQNWDAAHEVTLSNWDSQIPSETRKHGFIMTGNILQAFADAGDNGRVPGQLVTYTDIDGNVHDGILMNQHWEPSQLKGSTVPLRSRMEEIKNMPYGDSITSADGNVVIDRSFRYYTISVPKSKKVGGQYYENDALLGLVSGNNFYPSRGSLRGDVAIEDIEKVVEVLSDLGVQVQSDTQVRFDTETEMGQAQASGRRFDEDIEEGDKVPAVQKQLDKILKRYNTIAPVEILNTTDEFSDEKLRELFGDELPEESFDDAREYLRNYKTEGLYIPYSGKIVIFANNIGKRDISAREAFFHESLHAALHQKYGDNTRSICKQFWEVSTSPNQENNKQIIANGREQEEAEEEYFVRITARKLDKGTVQGVLERLDESGKNFLNDFLNKIGYDRTKEEARKGQEDVRGNEKENHPLLRGRDSGRIAKHIDNLVKKLGTKSRTTVYHSLDEVPEEVRKHIEDAHKRGRKVRGWYENGQVYLFLPDIDSIYQAEKTIWHETVAHHGLRQLIGEENLNKLLKQLWLTHKDGAMGEWVAERMQQNGWALNEAIEEYLAREAEKNPFKEPGLWQRLRWMLADILHKMGFSTDPTISDIQYLFWVSQNQLNDNDPMAKIRQQAFLFNLDREAANTPYVNMNATSVEDIDNPDAEGAYDDGIRHSEETDEEVIERLEKEPKVKAYRAMQLIDGKLYPPMAAKQGGKLVKPIELGKWEKADEHPEMADNNGKFKLDKGNGKSLKAAYNPYIHTSTTMLNDQFSEAQNRPNLVVVEVEVPESELTSGYKAEKAKDKVGKLEWKAGVIQGQLSGTREVILSRWDKPVRIVPTEEVAQHIADMIKGKVDVMPTNVVTPQQRAELEKLGVKFVETDNRGFIKEGENAGKSYSSVYGKKSGRRFDEDIDDPMTYSAKQVYNERMNTVETVFTEAYQDSMIALKTAQNAIAGDKDIPDSQNAYMAENLMHGKNKNEQDLFNRMFRDPLIATINKILNLTGMNWGDVDRYVYTKSGLERNRELYVRDWLVSERGKKIYKYEDLNTEEQDIYDGMAATIEDMFEDGDIDEAEKSKKLAQALQKAHQRYIDDLETQWIRLKNDRYTELRNGDITYPDYLNALSDFILDNIDGSYKPEENDYSGFRAMYGDEDGKYNEVDIISELMDTEDAINGEDDVKTTDTLWEQINAATQYALERYREAGMRSDEDIDRVEQMFHFYVPMRGFKAETGEDMYQYFTGKDRAKSYVGGLLKHAKGRGSEADFPISTIFAMSYKAIADCNQNLVNQKFYRLCQANPNDLVVLSDSWAVYDEIEGVWKESSPEIPEDAAEDEVRQITLDWDDRMRKLAIEHKAKKIKGKAEFDYKPIDKKNQSEHIIDVRINGQPKKMIVTSNPRMAQALNGQLRFEHGRNIFRRWNAAIKNFMASVFTSYSPTFALRNMARDWTHFRTMLGVREGSGYAKQANKYYRQSLFKMVGLFKKYRDGKLDESKEMERDFKDFMDNGGVTGFVFMQKIDDIQKEMENIYKKQKEGKTIRLNDNLWEKILGAVEALNEGIENNARFATYRASRHYAGRTKARSAYDAKEITVNFNRKGAGGKTAGYKSQSKAVQDAAKVFGVTGQILGEGKVFFNATVQAIATTFKNFQNADGSLNKKYIAKWAALYALPPFMFGVALPLINKALAAVLGGDDDDPYANLPEWTRRKNICIYIGNGNFITIPIGQELAAFLTLGDIFAGNTYAPDLKPIDRSWDDEILGVMNTFSPVDIDTKTTKGGLMEDPISEVTSRTFSVLAPLVAVEQNLGWTGRPIYKEDRFPNDKYKPEYQQVYQSTNPVLVGASKMLHEIGGGNDRARGKEWSEVNPAIIQYLWEQYTGGPGKVFSNTISIGKDAKDLFIEGEMPDFNIRKVEGLKAFVQQGDDRTQHYRTQAKFFKYQEDANKFKYDHDITKLRKQAKNDPVAKMELEKLEKTEEYQRFEIIEKANRSSKEEGKIGLDEFRKDIQNTTDRKEKRQKQQTYNKLMKGYVELLDAVGSE